MVTSEHFQRLKQMYKESESETSGEDLVISYGRAEVEGSIESGPPKGVAEMMPHHQLLREVSSLAAGTLEKDHFVIAESFTVNLVDSAYTGSVRARAEVVLAEPPRYIVDAALVAPGDEAVAEAHGSFRPGNTPLPSDSLSSDSGPDDQRDGSLVPPPASFMPVHTTPYGILCLN